MDYLEGEDDDDDEDDLDEFNDPIQSELKKSIGVSSKQGTRRGGAMETTPGGPPPGAGENIIEFKKLLNAGAASAKDGKEHLKNEIDRMISLLRSKQDVGVGVHTFRRIEPGSKGSTTAITLSQESRYEEV